MGCCCERVIRPGVEGDRVEVIRLVVREHESAPPMLAARGVVDMSPEGTHAVLAARMVDRAASGKG